MRTFIYPTSEPANEAAAEWLATCLQSPGTRNVMVAAGNTPLDLYRRIADRKLSLGHLNVFVLDEYVGVPPEDPGTCANLLRRTVQTAWGIPEKQFFPLSPVEAEAGPGIIAHERLIRAMGGLDVVILGLGQNGHLGFNEPGSARDCTGRLLDLEPISIEANRTWFQGKHAPSKGVTTGMTTILEARNSLVLAYGQHKQAAVAAMVDGPMGAQCPASWLQLRPGVRLYLDRASASGLRSAL